MTVGLILDSFRINGLILLDLTVLTFNTKSISIRAAELFKLV